MESKILLKSLSLVAIAGIIFFAMIIFFPTFNLSDRDFYIKSILSFGSRTPQSLINSNPTDPIVSSEQANSPALSAGQPIRLKIPGINVDAAIERVGLTSAGAMDVPKGQDNVAWFSVGPRPGENGSAVVAGHYGIKNGKGSVFDNLYKLRQGDKISIEDDKGEIVIFVVRESRRYDPNADAQDIFGSNDGKSHLNLITCEGVWNKAAKSYSMRLVVFADKE